MFAEMDLKRRAKIVCTIGPAVASAQRIQELIAAGMNVARLNLSHGDYAEHERVYSLIRESATRAHRPVAILVDLQGPKIRLGRFSNGPHRVEAGHRFVITVDDIDGTPDRASTTYKGLPGDCSPGDLILIDDGSIMAKVVEVTDRDVVTEIVQGGMVSNNKGINLPGVAVSVPAMSEKDRDDLRWALKVGADLIALSFVRNGRDIDEVIEIMTEVGRRVPVIAKIEKPQAVENLNEIIEAFDGLMVARGDLGVELPFEDVPMVQKRCITAAREMAKPVIVATQMLDSMINNPRPTRAEATDCANAVLDGADALMLSGETSVGQYPIQAVQTMARIIEKTESEALDLIPALKHAPKTKGGAITKAATEVGTIIGAKYLVAFTQSGDSARRMSRLRCAIPMLAFTPEEGTFNRLALSWGVEPIIVPMVTTTDEMVRQVDQILIESGTVAKGESVLIVAGSPPGIPGSTNAMRVHIIGAAVDGVAAAYRQ